MRNRTRALMVAGALGAGIVSLVPARGEPRRPVCLSREETRDAVQDGKIIRPVRAVAEAVRVGAGEPIGIRLCRNDAAMIYDVAVLRPDNRLVHILVDAVTGGLLPTPAGR